jgi:dodecin
VNLVIGAAIGDAASFVADPRRDLEWRPQMNDHVYTVTEIIGSSKISVEEAIQHGLKTAAKALRTPEWFEVTQIKGHIVDGGVGHYQVCMKLGSRHDPK